MREGKTERMIREALAPLQSKIDKQQNQIDELKAVLSVAKKKPKTSSVRKCPNCRKEIRGHPNKKFCSNKGPGNCKDAYHNFANPRGYGEESILDLGDDDQSWDAHKDHGF